MAPCCCPDGPLALLAAEFMILKKKKNKNKKGKGAEDLFYFLKKKFPQSKEFFTQGPASPVPDTSIMQHYFMVFAGWGHQCCFKKQQYSLQTVVLKEVFDCQKEG